MNFFPQFLSNKDLHKGVIINSHHARNSLPMNNNWNKGESPLLKIAAQRDVKANGIILMDKECNIYIYIYIALNRKD